MKKHCLIICLIQAFSVFVFCQKQEIYTQNIKGTVRDADSKSPLTGAAVTVVGIEPLLGSVSDTEGGFKIEKVPVGRYDVKISFIGYEPATVAQVLVTSGKEVFLTVGLKEMVQKLDAVVIKAAKNNQNPLNEMATLSARSFSVEETKRYAGSFSDPARMAVNFAGVASSGELSNEIVVRGNSPKGVLWRLEGIEIPNPNHFGSLGGSGGGVSMLSAGTLSNSDFYTGAFPAEFGNAVSGVFDLKLRNGNTDRREFALQAGALGLETTAEGYFRKGGRSSYLFNYRYSTTGLIAYFVPFLKEFVPKYQDASFKLHFPTEKYGTFTVFGLGGYNISARDVVADSTKWVTARDQQGYAEIGTNAILGASYKFFFSEKTYLNSVLALSKSGGTSKSFYLDKKDKYKEVPTSEDNFVDNTLKANVFLNHKFNAQHTVRFGGVWSHTAYTLESKDWNSSTKKWLSLFDNRGQGDFFQVYGQWKYRITEGVTLNTGLHYTRLLLNNTDAFEPRTALQWQFSPRQTVSFSAGLHSRPEHFSVYLLEKTDNLGVKTFPNKFLEIPKAAHFVVGYDHNFGNDWHLKAEIYYQSLYNIGVERDSVRGFSMLNQNTTWDVVSAKPLVSSGTGRNIGLDLTIEKFFSKNYYTLITATLFDAKYEDIIGRSFNGFYNYRYVFNALAGKDFNMGKTKRNILSVNGKFILRGGNRYTPIDEIQSKKLHREVPILSRRYEGQVPAYWRIDWGVQYKINRARLTHTWLFELANTLNRKNVAFQYFDTASNTLKYTYQLSILPNVSYRIEF